MSNKLKDDRIAYKVTVGEIQQESVRLIGRKLNNDELESAIDGIDWGLSTGIFIVFKAAIEQAVELNH